jgi:arsenite-transporting ATPase
MAGVVDMQKEGLPMQLYYPSSIELTKYFFFTGKGGVGKTSVACATAVNLADSGKNVMLISTDPASNLQDVFGIELDNKGTPIPEVPNLTVVNLDPIEAAQAYKEKVIGRTKGCYLMRQSPTWKNNCPVVYSRNSCLQ